MSADETVAQRATLPLAHAQEPSWLLHELEPEQPANRVIPAVRLRGSLNVDALECALAQLVARHELLRARFCVVNGEPRQYFGSDSEVHIERVNAKCADPDAEVLRHMRVARSAPVNLERGPLLKARLLEFGQDDHALLITVDHLVFDAASGTVVLAELAQLYSGQCVGKPIELVPPSQRYADWIGLQRDSVANGDLVV